jgi:beta-lactamase class D
MAIICKFFSFRHTSDTIVLYTSNHQRKLLYKGSAEQVSFALAGSFSVMLRHMTLDVAMLRLRAIFLA